MISSARPKGWSPARRLRAGLQLVEVLAAGVIFAVSLAAIVSMFAFVFGMTQRNDDKSVAYNIARIELEKVRFEGFSNALVTKNSSGVVTSKFVDGTRVSYYDGAGTLLSNNTGAVYSATLVVTSSQLDTMSDGTQRPAADSTRTAIVTVRRASTNEVLHTDGTQMVRSGV